jgi:hypothetical protein
MYARTNRCYNERGSKTKYVRCSLLLCTIFSPCDKLQRKRDKFASTDVATLFSVSLKSGPMHTKGTIRLFLGWRCHGTFLSFQLGVAKDPVFWNTAPCLWALSPRRFGRLYCLHLHDQVVQEEISMPKFVLSRVKQRPIPFFINYPLTQTDNLTICKHFYIEIM